MGFIRVRDKETGHEFDVAETAFDDQAMTKVNAPKQYPDLTADDDRPRAVKYRSDKAGQPATTEESR